MNKEREAFNLWLKHYDRHEVKIDQLQRALMWQAWQAKAQAVPDGFVLVNKKDLVKVLNCVSDDWLIDTESFEEFKNIESLVQPEIESMIESWSQNDH